MYRRSDERRQIMKLPKILIIIALVVCIFGIPKDGNAVSLQGCISTGIIEANTHSHVSVLPSRIYAVLVTPTSANGYVQIFDTKSVVNDTLGDGRVGNEYVSTNKCLADL